MVSSKHSAFTRQGHHEEAQEVRRSSPLCWDATTMLARIRRGLVQSVRAVLQFLPLPLAVEAEDDVALPGLRLQMQRSPPCFGELAAAGDGQHPDGLWPGLCITAEFLSAHVFFVCLTIVPEVVYHSGVLLRSDLCVCRSICGQGGVSQRSSSPLCHLCLPFHLSPWCIRAEFFSASISLQVTIECFWRPVVLERSCSALRSVSNIQVWQGIDRFMSRSCVVGNDVEFHTSMLLDSLLSNSATPIAFMSAG